MPGVMSQMVAERPNAGPVRHQDRFAVIRRPGGGGFVLIVAHCITPTDVAAES
jgi:lipoate-protein ligase A